MACSRCAQKRRQLATQRRKITISPKSKVAGKSSGIQSVSIPKQGAS